MGASGRWLPWCKLEDLRDVLSRLALNDRTFGFYPKGGDRVVYG